MCACVWCVYRQENKTVRQTERERWRRERKRENKYGNYYLLWNLGEVEMGVPCTIFETFL